MSFTRLASFRRTVNTTAAEGRDPFLVSPASLAGVKIPRSLTGSPLTLSD